MTQHRDPGGYTLSSLRKASIHSVSSSVSSSLCPPPPSALLEPRLSACKWKVMHWLFKRLFLSLAICLWQRATLLLFTAGCYLCTLWALMLWGFQLKFMTPHFSGGSTWLLKYPSGPSAAACGCPASSPVFPLHSLPVRLCWSWFFSLSWVIRLLSHYCSLVCSGWSLHNLVLIPYLS